MESEVDRIRGENVWIGACANIQQQPKRTGGSRIEERGNKERTGAGISQREGVTNGDKGRRHGSRSVPRTGQIRMNTWGKQ
jgi:hypothetical protein